MRLFIQHRTFVCEKKYSHNTCNSFYQHDVGRFNDVRCNFFGHRLSCLTFSTTVCPRFLYSYKPLCPNCILLDCILLSFQIGSKKYKTSISKTPLSHFIYHKLILKKLSCLLVFPKTFINLHKHDKKFFFNPVNFPG